MPTPGGFLSGAILPWVLIGPLLPLCIIILRRTAYSSLVISLILLCVVSLLTGFYNLAVPQELPAASSFRQISSLLEFLFTILVLKTCTVNILHRNMIISAGLIYCGIFLTILLLKTDPAIAGDAEKFGYALLFAISLSVIVMCLNSISEPITDISEFWVAGGIFFHAGLMCLLLFLNNNLNPGQLPADKEFGVMYIIISSIRYVFFAIGMMMVKIVRR